MGVLTIGGAITQRSGFFTDFFCGTGLDEMSAALNQAVADPYFTEIILEFDSPGGSVYGVEEFAMLVYAARKAKKVTGVVNSTAASAAYWIAAQCSELIVTPGGEVGSIGVYMMHKDVSKAMEARGEKVTFVSAGELKTAGNPFEPLDGAAKAIVFGTGLAPWGGWG